MAISFEPRKKHVYIVGVVGLILLTVCNAVCIYTAHSWLPGIGWLIGAPCIVLGMLIARKSSNPTPEDLPILPDDDGPDDGDDDDPVPEEAIQAEPVVAKAMRAGAGR